MSTKTTFKRIALVAVASLGFGVLSSVAPATAGANANITAITAGTSSPARVSVLSGATSITLTHASTTGQGSDTITAQIVASPATSSAAVLSFANSSTAAASAFANTASTVTNQLDAEFDGIAKAVITPRQSATTTDLTLSLNADVAGTYTILVTADAASGAGYSAGKKSVSYSITTAGAPTALTATAVAGTVTTTGLGQIFGLSMKDAAGNATVLGLNESILVSDNSDATTLYLDVTSSSNSNEVSAFGSSSSSTAGVYYLRAAKTATLATGTATLTFTGSGLLPATLTVNTTVTLQATTTALTGSTVDCTTATNCTGVSASGNQSISTSGSQGLTFTNTSAFGNATASATTSTYHEVQVMNASGLYYSSYATVAAAATALKVAKFTAPAPTLTVSPTVTLGGVTATMVYDAPEATTLAVVGSDSVLSAVAGTTTWVIKVTDQYTNGIQYAPVTVAVAGRNTVLEKSIGVTDANGFITYSHKDAGTTGTTDTLTFDSGALTADLATVTYGTVTVSKVSFTGGSTTKGVTAATPVVNAIEADDTPESATQDATVTVTDAAGNLLAGVPVVFTVSDATKLAVTTTTATVYTTSAGIATAKVFAWIAGTHTVTATAGGVTGTGSYTFANSRAADARVLSAKSADGIITATVVDRFGNPVSGVTVYASRTSGTGYFGTGVSKTSTTTGVDGTAEFTMIGTAEVKVSTLDYNALPGVNAAGQTCALAGNLDCAVGTTAAEAFTATTAGTAAVDAENVGSSFAPAGVSAVTVSVSNNAAADNAQAATDAAAEATDAANAATDAANAAAEAADAATAAAQDAADAVAALSTQVTELVSALRKQITSLTNLVIKIQKKVKA